MSFAEIQYTIHMQVSPEQVWRGLTEPTLTEQWWGTRFESDWTPGSTMSWTEAGVRTENPEQLVLEFRPPHRLAYTWHTLTPEWAAAYNFSQEFQARVSKEPRTQAIFDIEETNHQTQLTVTHCKFIPGSEILQMCTPTWPRLLSDLKTLLESEARA